MLGGGIQQDQPVLHQLFFFFNSDYRVKVLGAIWYCQITEPAFY
jgi:hypothetical protein